MSLNVCRRCGIPVWSAPTKFCRKCLAHFALAHGGHR